jgi:hypothetical protein
MARRDETQQIYTPAAQPAVSGDAKGTAWGDAIQGVRFGLRAPEGALEAGSTIQLELVCQNKGLVPVWLFGFVKRYPRSLRVSPPKPDRPYIRVSFGDVNVLHPPEAYVRLEPGKEVATGLDLSFAFDRRGAGTFSIAFAYEAVRAAGMVRPWRPNDGSVPLTGIATIDIERARALREAGVDAATEQALDAMLVAGDPSTVERLRALGPGGPVYAARRVARVVAGGSEAALGWRALEALEVLGDGSAQAIRNAREELPHAAVALDFARDWLDFRLGKSPNEWDLPFVTALTQLVDQPDRRGNFLLSWSPYDSPIHGALRMELFGNGDRIVVVRPPGQAVPSTRRTHVAPMHMKALLEALVMSGAWLLRPLRAQGLPDEPRPALEIQLALGENFTRKIALWNGEWRQGPAFRLADILDRLAAK